MVVRGRWGDDGGGGAGVVMVVVLVCGCGGGGKRASGGEILKEKDNIQKEIFKVENEKLIIQHETQLAKKAFRAREDRYLDDIVDLE
ncbi:hypothetical protein Tco_1065563 [Tanacetum coccineum]